MARKKKELPEICNVEITGIAAEGKAIAKIKFKDTDPNPMVVFIPYGAPGDIVNIKIDKKKHSYAEAHITQIVKPSPLRIAPKCEYFGVCGGCRWQHLPYNEQLKFKGNNVKDALQRIGKVELPVIKETLGSKQIWEYRNKMEYTFSDRRWRSWEEMKNNPDSDPNTPALGFHIPGSFDKVLDIKKCWLQDHLGDRIRNFIRNYALEKGYSFYNIKNNRGLLRNLMIRPALSGEVMVCLVFGENNPEIFKDILESCAKEFPEITNLVYTINLKLNDSITDQEIITFKGPGYIEENLEDLKFRISPKSFFQTNTRQTVELYNKVAEFAGLLNDVNEKPLVYDLYTGTGSIANFIARNARKVIGIEYVEDAIKDARINSEINKIYNTEFFAGDMKDVLTPEFINQHGKPDIMIIDPPRAGMHEDVVKVIMNSAPSVVIYVSCNPSTQARDLALMDQDYKVTEVQPVDMFPHTQHVENVVKLIHR